MKQKPVPAPLARCCATVQRSYHGFVESSRPSVLIRAARGKRCAEDNAVTLVFASLVAQRAQNLVIRIVKILLAEPAIEDGLIANQDSRSDQRPATA